MFELSCHTWGFSDQPLEEAIQTIARLGFNYIDLGSGPHLDINEAAKSPKKTAREIKPLLDTFHLQLTDLYLLLPGLSSVDEGRRLYEVKQFEGLLKFAIELGTPGITLSPGIETPEITEARIPRIDAVELRPSEPPDPDADMVTYATPQDDEAPPEHKTPTPFDHAVDSFQQIIEIAEDADLRISIEPHLDSITATPDKALQLLDAVPGLSLTLDWAQFTAQGIISREIEPLLQHAAHVQLRQASRSRLQTPFDEGIIDFEQVLALLVKHDYRGAVSIEYMNRAGWHGLAALDIVQETAFTRNEIRRIRDQLMADTTQ